MHWASQRRYAKAVLEAAWIAKNQAGIRGRPKLRGVELHIELTIGGVMDHDNAVGACKPYIDALVKLGILEDDTPECVTAVFVTQKKAPRKDRGAMVRVEPSD